MSISGEGALQAVIEMESGECNAEPHVNAGINASEESWY